VPLNFFIMCALCGTGGGYQVRAKGGVEGRGPRLRLAAEGASLQGEEAATRQLPDEGATLIRVSACSSLAGVGKPWRPVALLVPSCFVA